MLLLLLEAFRGAVDLIQIQRVRAAQTANFQYFGTLHQIRQTRLRYVHFSFVHKVHQRLDGPELDVAREDDDWMLARVFAEQIFEVRRARGQHQPVAVHLVPFACQRHIDEPLAGQKLWKGCSQAAQMAVPANTELLRLSGTHCLRVCMHGTHFFLSPFD